MPKLVITNVTDGPKVLNASPVITLPAGQSTGVPVEISEEEAASAEASGWFSLSRGDADDDGLAGHTVAQLKDIAEAEGIDLGDATKKADIIAAIELAREEAQD